MEDWIARTFNGAEPLQIGIALVITLIMAWVFWVGARNSRRPPPPSNNTTPGESA